MSLDADAEETQRRILRALIAETQGSTRRYEKELEIFAEAFSHTCGHNRLERIGLRWSGAMTPEQSRVLSTDRKAANEFASYLHRALMQHLLPTDDELLTLSRTSLSEWAAALRMGVQGVLRRRAHLNSGGDGPQHDYSQPDETFLLSVQPAVRRAADEFFLARSGPTDTTEYNSASVR